MTRAAVVVGLFFAGCFSPHLTNGGLKCGSDDKCPPGFHCAVADGRCWKLGEEPPDGGDVDLSVPLDLAVTLGDEGVTGDLGTVDLTPPPLANGALCAHGADCASGFCADGVCCNEQCTGACLACNSSASPGLCANVASGAAPAAGHATCGPDDPTTCGRDGLCDGAGQCRLWNNVVCKPGSCDSGTNTALAAWKCDGNHTCVMPNAIVCDPYVCLGDGSACYATCTGAATGCKSPSSCTAGSCGTKPNGSPCAAGTDCTSTHCSPDGYCCDGACTGKCEACDIGTSRGTCTAVTSGQPEAAHGGNCPGSGLCAGACAAGNRATCSFPGKELANPTCAAQICSDVATQANAAQCDGAGACKAQTTTACLSFKCVGSACAGACGGNDDTNCAAGYFCNGTQCLTTRPNGRSCGVGGDCTSGNCVDGYCCDTAASSCNGCRMCNATGSCVNVPQGSDPHGSCGANSASCVAGGCNGSNACTPSANGTVCAQSCVGTSHSVATCNGTTTGCPSPTTTTCGGGQTCFNNNCCTPSCSNGCGTSNRCGGTCGCSSGLVCKCGSCVCSACMCP